MKTLLPFAAALLGLTSLSQGATYYVNNVITGDTNDWLFEDGDGTLLDGGIVALGNFGGVTPDVSDIATLLATFNSLASGLTGSFSIDLGGSFPGYIQVDGDPSTPGVADPVQGPLVTGADPLIGTSVYMFVGNASTLAASTLFALAEVGTYSDDDPLEAQYNANPFASFIPVGGLGSFDTFTGDPGTGANGTYNTLKLAAPVPEPSVALIGALGALGFLRRRR